MIRPGGDGQYGARAGVGPEELLARAAQPGQEAMRLHPFYRGKMQTVPKCPVRSFDDFAIWYSPGVAAPCRAIAADPEQVYAHTNKANSVAIVTDGTRVLGLGDIGPEAGLPVMEGKALLFKYLGGVDAVPICLGTKDPDELIRTVQLLAPAFGAINLEDIAQPKCFRILDALRGAMAIPVWHDDQQGSATALLAGLLNALKLVGKERQHVRIAMDILPRMDEWDVHARVAVAAAMAAQRQGVARLEMSREQVYASAVRVMREAREMVRVLMREGLIPAPPAPGPQVTDNRVGRDAAPKEAKRVR